MRKELLLLILVVAIAILGLANFSAKSILATKEKEIASLRKDGEELSRLKAKWAASDAQKQQIEGFAAQMGKEYFSAAVTKKEFKGNLYQIGLLVMNSDEFDAITRKILNTHWKINKLNITNNDVGYLIDLEFSL